MEPMRQFVCTVRLQLPAGKVPTAEGFKHFGMRLLGYSEEPLSPPPAALSTQYIAPGGFDPQEFGKF